MDKVEHLQTILDELRRRSLDKFVRYLKNVTPSTMLARIDCVLWDRVECALTPFERWLVCDVVGVDETLVEERREHIGEMRPEPGAPTRETPIIPRRYLQRFIEALDENGKLPHT